MTERVVEPAFGPCRPSTGQVTLVSAILAISGVLLVVPALGGPGATGTIGLVLTEAVALYVGYGALTRVVSPAVRGILAGD